MSVGGCELNLAVRARPGIAVATPSHDYRMNWSGGHESFCGQMQEGRQVSAHTLEAPENQVQSELTEITQVRFLSHALQDQASLQSMLQPPGLVFTRSSNVRTPKGSCLDDLQAL